MFDARVVEVKLDPGTDHAFSMLQAGVGDLSVDIFKPASEHAYAIIVTPSAGQS